MEGRAGVARKTCVDCSALTVLSLSMRWMKSRAWSEPAQPGASQLVEHSLLRSDDNSTTRRSRRGPAILAFAKTCAREECARSVESLRRKPPALFKT
eukprot:247099-Rhodomonas_salina.2